MDQTTDPDVVPRYEQLLSLRGRALIVAGAGPGIGRHCAHALAALGASVMCVSTNAGSAERVAAEVHGRSLVADVTERDQVERVIEATRKAFGRLDGIVDIVGKARFLTVAETQDEDWNWTLRRNLRHAFLLTQIGGRALAASGGGSIVFVSSVSGLTGSEYHGAYGAAKAAMLSLVRTAAVELGPSGVRVNAVAPGIVWTPRMSDAIGEQHRAVWARASPLQRVALPSDVASAVLYLATDLSADVTGQTIVVDGGAGLRFPFPIETLR